MEFVEYLNYFLTSETPFMLLFVILFFYTVRTNKEREKELNRLLQVKLSTIEEQLNVLIKVWHILLEKELEEKK